MPKIERSIEHDLAIEEAKLRLDRFLHEAGKTIHLQHQWRGEQLAFEANIQGINISGTAKILPTELQFKVKLPLIALPFSSWINRIMKLALKSEIPVPETAPQPGPMQEVFQAQAQNEVLLFLHIPKAAGTTLGEYLFAQCRNGRPYASALAREGLFQEGIYYAPFGFFKAEETLIPEYAVPYLRDEQLRAVIGHISYGIHTVLRKPATYFTLLRHPVDRMLSLYYFLQANENISLREFLAGSRYRELDNDQTRRIAGVDPAFGACTAAHFELAKTNLQQHFILAGISDRFDESVLLLKRAMGWQQDFLYYPRNVTKNRPKIEEISADEYESILALNKWDLQLYEWVNQLMDDKIAALGPSFAVELANYQQQLPAQKITNS